MLLSYSCRGITEEEIRRITQHLSSSKELEVVANSKVPSITVSTEFTLGNERKDRWELQTGELLNDLKAAASRRYDEEIEQITVNISKVVGERIRGLIRSGIISPISSAVVSTSISYVMDEMGLRETLEEVISQKTTANDYVAGVSAGDGGESGLLEPNLDAPL